MSDPAAIEVDEFFPYPPELVWRALTEPDLLAKWWAAGDVKPVVGHRFDLDMGPWGRQACEVVEVDEPRLLRYTFAESSLDTMLSWRLVPEGSGTRLFLVHDGFDLGSPLGKEAFGGMGEGWPKVVAAIGPVVAGLAAAW